jgi:hypothetical protein
VPTVDVLAHELAEVARNLRQAGDTELLAELKDGINEAVADVPREIIDRLPEYLPNRYAAVLSRDISIRITNRSRSGGQTVRIYAPERGSRTVERRRLLRLNRGTLAHPLFGNRRHWYDQAVKPFFFDEPIEERAPQIRQDIEDALARVEDKIFKGAHR